MELPLTDLPEHRHNLIDLGAAGLLGGFAALLLLGLFYSSSLFNAVAAPFLLGAVVLVYAGNRRLQTEAQIPPTPPGNPNEPPSA